MQGITDNLAGLLLERAALSATQPAVLYKHETNWLPLTYGEIADRAMVVARGLRAMGVEPEQRVVIMARTSTEWLVCAWATLFSGCVLVPLHHTTTAADFEEFFKTLKPRFVFLGDPEALAPIRDLLQVLEGRVALFKSECVVSDAPGGRRPYLRLEDVVRDRGEVVTLAQLETLGREWSGRFDPQAIAAHIPSSSDAAIIYTPGTVAQQKGVVLSHRSLLYQARTLNFVLPIRTDDVQLLFLPLSHVLGIVAFLSSISSGSLLALGGGVRGLLEDMYDVRPTYMVGVPRVYEKIVEKLISLNRDLSLPWREVFQRGLTSARVLHESGLSMSTLLARLQYDLARRTVFQRCRDLFGGRMRLVISGGAPLPLHVAHAINAFGIPLLEGFGLTETGGATHVNRLGSNRIGTVGQALPMIETRIAQDGEVFVRGPNLMTGYLDDDESTRMVLDGDGWMHTGDVGEIENGGYLRITGRKKNIMVTATGKNILPARLEAGLSSIGLISHVIVVGDGRPYVSALLTLNRPQVTQWAQDRGLPFDNFERLAKDVDLYRELERRIEEVNLRFAPHERVRRFAILESDFGVETGELTHTFKVKRGLVLERYQDVISMLYKERY